MRINYKACPKCGNKNGLKILYGMPVHEDFERAEKGEIWLGGIYKTYKASCKKTIFID